MSNNSNEKTVSGPASVSEENVEDLDDLRRSSRRKRARVNYVDFVAYCTVMLEVLFKYSSYF